MHTDAKSVVQHGEYLFNKKRPFDSLCQEIADHFYVERADFTVTRSLGAEFADHLTTSYPSLMRRDMGDMVGGMLRPTDKQWLHITTDRYENPANESLRWMEDKAKIMLRAMRDPDSGFSRATKESDHDFVTFGQCVMSVELNKRKQALLYRNWHLRDVAWCESVEGKVADVHRKWKPTLAGLLSLESSTFKVHDKVKRAFEKEKYREIDSRHVVIEAEQYQSGDIKKKYKTPYISFHYDLENNHCMEEIGINNKMYVIPRWMTVSGSQYAYSPATIVSLSDARLIQAMTLTLLEAGEMAVRPPMIATQEAIRGDVNLVSGGITWVDSEYDEKLGEVLRPVTQNNGGIPLGFEMQNAIKETIFKAFYLDKMGLPPLAGGMSPMEVSQRVGEYVRQALPLFEPMENEYNGGLSDITFDLLMRGGAFGRPEDIPSELQGEDIKFRFESPLQEALEHIKGQKFLEAKAMLREAVELDPSVRHILDAKTTIRDVLSGIGSPAKWINSEETVDKMAAEDQQKQGVQEMAGMVQQGAGVAQQVAQADMAMKQAEKA